MRPPIITGKFLMNTQSFKQSDIEESWIVVDAKEKVLGRLATKLAFRLRGKHKPEYSPNADLGDFIVVINAGAGIMVGGKAKSLADGIKLAEEVIVSGSAKNVLESLAAVK